MKTYKSESNVKPIELDVNVDTVYRNYNIVETTREDEEGNTTIFYEYDVDEYPIQEYVQANVVTNKALIDDIIAAMLGGK